METTTKPGLELAQAARAAIEKDGPMLTGAVAKAIGVHHLRLGRTLKDHGAEVGLTRLPCGTWAIQ